LNVALILCSAISFLGYGSACFLSASLKREFDRYRLGSQRALIGGFQFCAALGLLAGLTQPWMGRVAAGGLALMMMVDHGARNDLDAFLAAHPEWHLVPASEVLSAARIPLPEGTGDCLELRPDLHGTDGFFAAVLERR
jgi:hypothetical protein